MLVQLLSLYLNCSAKSVEVGRQHGSSERIEFLDNGKVRIGVNLELGGAITFLAKSSGGPNMINSYDWGRQIQMSHYSGPTPFVANGKLPKKEWEQLGWNPIQSGDCYGNRSKLLEYKNNGKTIYTKCTPMQWPLNNEPGECIFESWINLEGKTVKVRNRLKNNRSDLAQHTGRDQELPAIYTNGPWHRLVTYSGTKPYTNDKLSQVPSTFPWNRWQATENWAALLNDDGEGLGVWQDEVTTFIGGFAGKPGSGTSKDFATGYIAPLRQEILDHNITYDYQYTLILGSIEEIRQTVYAQRRNQDSPSFRFKKDRQHWWYFNATDSGWPIKDELKISLNQNDPQLLSPTGFWSAAANPRLEIEAAFQTKQTDGQLFWARADAQSFRPERSLPVKAIGDGKFRKYIVNLSSSSEYRGHIVTIRWDPTPGNEKGSFVRVRSIKFCQ